MAKNRPNTTDKVFTAGDVQATANVSYRQLNDWDNKGAVPADKNRGEGWRKFSARDLFAIMVCADLRNRFGIPLEHVKFVHQFMRKDGTDHFHAAFKLMKLGLSVYLLTDFKETFILDSDLEFEWYIEHGYFRADHPQGYVFLRLNDIVNRLLGCMKEPTKLTPDNDLYRKIAKDRTRMTARTIAELKILDFLREKDIDKMIISRRSGSITRVELERQISVKTDEQASRYVVPKESAFETIEFSSHDNKVGIARRRISHKFGADDNQEFLFATRIQTK